MNPLLKRNIRNGLFFLFAAVFGVLFFLMMFKDAVEHGISNFYYMLEIDTFSYLGFDIANLFGRSFSSVFSVLFICLFAYAIYLFFEEKHSPVGNFIGFVPVKKPLVYFYKWICGGLILAAAFAVAAFIAGILLVFFNTDVKDVYGYYNGIIETYNRQNEIYYSLAGDAVSIFLYLACMLCACVFVFSIILFAFAAFGKIIHAAAFAFSIVVLGFSVLFICSDFYVFPDSVMAEQVSGVTFIQPVCNAVMSFYDTIRSMLSLQTKPNYNSIYMLQNTAEPLNRLYSVNIVHYLVGIVICAAGSFLFFLLGRKIYSDSEISRNDKVLMTKSLKIPAIIYVCVFSFMFLAMLAVMAMDIVSG